MGSCGMTKAKNLQVHSQAIKFGEEQFVFTSIRDITD
jgi:hypothetical protein